VCLDRELNLNDVPDLLSDFFIKRKGLTHLHHSLGCDLQKSFEEHIVWLELSFIFRSRVFFIVFE
jgi:hypothetical protein